MEPKYRFIYNINTAQTIIIKHIVRRVTFFFAWLENVAANPLFFAKGNVTTDNPLNALDNTKLTAIIRILDDFISYQIPNTKC